MPRTVLDKVVDVIKLLAEPGGASRVAIAKSMAANHGEIKPALMKKALASGVQKGVLQQSGQRFGLAGEVLEAKAGATVEKTIVKAGSGEACEVGDTVDMAYVGTLDDGTKFDAAGHFKFTLGAGEVIKGWDQGVLGMLPGEKAKLVVPSTLGYGKRGAPPEIPGDATLHFTVTLNKVM